MKNIYIIPECNLVKLEEIIKKVNNSSKKLGLAETTFNVCDVNHSTYLVRTENHAGDPFWVSKLEDRHIVIAKRDWYNVEVTGSQPKFDGWEFCATLAPIPTDNGMENMIRKVPTCKHNIPADYRNRVGQCDHCYQNRRRNETYVVRNDNGEFKMVGSSCMKDFLGHIDPHAISAYLECIFSIDSLQNMSGDFEHSYNREEEYYDVKQVLNFTSIVINKHGWLSKKKANEDGGLATADIVYLLFRPPYKLSHYENELIKDLVPADADNNKTEKVFEWMKNIDPNTDNEYLYNLSLLSRVIGINSRSLGILCSAVSAYDRETAKKQQNQNNYANSDFVGKVKDRICINVNVNRKNKISSDFGTTIIHHMTDDHGNYLVWFCTSDNDLDEGQSYNVKATIKKHDLYNGVKQTLVNRVSVIGVS